MQRETSFADENSKRLRLVSQAMLHNNFQTTIEIVDLLMAPLDMAMNRLLKRTTCLKKLRFQDVSDADGSIHSMKESCKNLFMSWCSGEFGRNIMQDFLKNLSSYDLAAYCRACRDPSMPRVFFQLTVFSLSDTWRRFCLPQQSCPWQIFLLEACSQADFFAKWDEFVTLWERCSDCMDAGFTVPLLQQGKHVLQLADLAAPAQFRQDVQKLLRDIATFSPLATDSVENLHGQNQFNQFTWRGRSKASPAAAEVSVLSALAIEHAHLKSVVMSETMPSRMVMAQMTKHIAKPRKRELDQRAAQRPDSPKKRLAKAAGRRPRSLSPWNVFLRTKLKGRGRLNKQEYAAACCQIADEWKTLENKDRYRVETAYEQTCRTELAARPLTTALQAACSQGSNQESSSAVSIQTVAATDQSTWQLETIAGLDGQIF